MRVILITSNHAPEVIELVDTEDKLRQCAARLRCPADKLNVRREEIDENIFTVLTPPETEDAPITGTDYETGEPIVRGSFIICRYDDTNGLMRDIKDKEIVKIASGFNGSAITTFNASRAKFEERQEKAERELNSPAAISATAMIYSSFISAMRIEYGNRYINNVDGSGRVYRDILSEHPDIAEFVREHPDKMAAYAKYLD